MKATLLASRRRALPLAFLVVLGFALVALATAAPAMAQEKTCAEQVVADWYDNGRVDKIYPLHCYREAINSLGPDITDYSNAKEAILRALTYAEAGQKDPGPNGRGVKGSLVKPIAWRHTADVTAIIEPGHTQTTGSGQPPSTAGPSSVPIPLIVLAGLAGLLLVAGGAGYVARRVQSRRGGPPSP